ncbi:hypothetical protein RRG08_031041 [Elysia crispata]|uniref:Uncharacterized protein n=1 Tax=Elysia crispata TaxID=231223 RepID=A0AAE0ZF89_9GAST|nr:hypothetical protein RRG08_031041 [Elysia crispata]
MPTSVAGQSDCAQLLSPINGSLADQQTTVTSPDQQAREAEDIINGVYDDDHRYLRSAPHSTTRCGGTDN